MAGTSKQKRRRLAPKLTAAEARKNWKDAHPPLTPEEAHDEANRCIYCYDAPCTKACPTAIDVPSFIRSVATGDLRGAAKTILDANPLGGSCARACPTEELCEGACVFNAWDRKPIPIGLLQRRAMDHVMAEKYEPLPAPAKGSGGKMAVIGAGPAGLSCAAVLARLGHSVTIYEARPKPGGLNTYGVAMYKVTPRYSIQEAAAIRRLGVRFRHGVRVGKKPTVAELLEKHVAVFVGAGLGDEWRPGIAGENLRGVVPGLDFLEDIHTKSVESARVGDRVVVIGCGNTAIDAARAAKRLGAGRVIVLYRRSASEMPAYEHEYVGAIADGVEFRWLTSPVRFLGKGTVTGVRCVSMRLGRTDDSGRPRPTPVKGSEHTIPCDQAVYSIGQRADTSFLATIDGLSTDRSGNVIVDPDTMETSVPRLYAGGDCINGGKEVVNAAQDGKIAAQTMDARFRAGKGAR